MTNSLLSSFLTRKYSLDLKTTSVLLAQVLKKLHKVFYHVRLYLSIISCCYKQTYTGNIIYEVRFQFKTTSDVITLKRKQPKKLLIRFFSLYKSLQVSNCYPFLV